MPRASGRANVAGYRVQGKAGLFCGVRICEKSLYSGLERRKFRTHASPSESTATRYGIPGPASVFVASCAAHAARLFALVTAAEAREAVAGAAADVAYLRSA